MAPLAAARLAVLAAVAAATSFPADYTCNLCTTVAAAAGACEWDAPTCRLVHAALQRAPAAMVCLSIYLSI